MSFDHNKNFTLFHFLQQQQHNNNNNNSSTLSQQLRNTHTLVINLQTSLYFNMENKMIFSTLVGLIFASMVTCDSNPHQIISPSSSYNPPATSYNQQPVVSSSYSEPLSYSSQSSTGYGESTSYEDGQQQNAFDLSLIVIPLLIIAGVSLLFPTITNVTTRKRRNTDVGKIITSRVHNTHS